MARAGSEFGKIDFLLHAIAFASMDDLKRDTIETSRGGFMMAMEISAYSLIAVANAAHDVLADNAAIATMTYFGGEKAVPGYNVMGICKAALDSIVKYLAFDLGPRGIRVNARQRRPDAHAGRPRRRRRRHAGLLREDGAAGPQHHARRSGPHRRVPAVQRCPTASPARSCTSTAATTSWVRPAGCSKATRCARSSACRTISATPAHRDRRSPSSSMRASISSGCGPQGAALAGFWEFPGGKVRAG